jgi:hypothetical protein
MAANSPSFMVLRSTPRISAPSDIPLGITAAREDVGGVADLAGVVKLIPVHAL